MCWRTEVYETQAGDGEFGWMCLDCDTDETGYLTEWDAQADADQHTGDVE